MFKSVAIGAQRGVVIHTASHVGPVAGLDLAVRGLFEIEDVECLRRTGDHFGSLPGVLGQAASLEERGHSAKGGDIRACGQKLQKFAAGSANRRVFHGGVL